MSKLEKDEITFAINAPITTTPPLYSSFYWKNGNGKKYKAFLPTKNRKYYYNLEEYNFKEIDLDTVDEKLVHYKMRIINYKL